MLRRGQLALPLDDAARQTPLLGKLTLLSCERTPGHDRLLDTTARERRLDRGT
jgi:hypothetical protein